MLQISMLVVYYLRNTIIQAISAHNETTAFSCCLQSPHAVQYWSKFLRNADNRLQNCTASHS